MAGRPRKPIEKCAADYCRALSLESDVFCGDHQQDLASLPRKPTVLAWVQTCFVCSHETFHEMTEEDHDKLVARYKLICAKCKGMSVTLNQVDHLVSRAA